MALNQAQIRLLKEAAQETDSDRLLALVAEVLKSFEHRESREEDLLTAGSAA